MTDANPSTAAEDAAEQFIAAAIDRAPECARRLGEYLAAHLDDDNFGPADRMLLGLVEQMLAAAARAEKAEAERDTAQRWQPIETAPKDRPILAWCDHEADPYSVDDKTVTTYAAHAEGLGNAPTGYHIVEWGGGWTESYEDGGGEMPDWWFVAGSEFEVAANPTHWMPLPAAPTNPEDIAHD